MPHRQALTLRAEPRSAQDARRWVVRICQLLDRRDLADCAELAISELVTNAILHGRPPIRLQVRGTHHSPRFEVYDGSTVPPQPPTRGSGVDLGALDIEGLDALDDIDLTALTAVGRGLDIVARASTAWGTIIEEDGKTVWFEPAAQFRDEGAPYQFVGPPTGAPAPADSDRITVRVVGLPVHEFSRFQRHYRELRREVRLLSVAHADSYPLATTLSEYFDVLEGPLRESMGREQVDQAIASGLDSVDLELRIPVEVARRIGGLIELLDVADDFCRNERLLTVARDEEQRDFQAWFLGEFERQAEGEPPMPWEGHVPADDGSRRYSDPHDHTSTIVS